MESELQLHVKENKSRITGNKNKKEITIGNESDVCNSSDNNPDALPMRIHGLGAKYCRRVTSAATLGGHGSLRSPKGSYSGFHENIFKTATTVFHRVLSNSVSKHSKIRDLESKVKYPSPSPRVCI
jgi:hypothetical protein